MEYNECKSLGIFWKRGKRSMRFHIETQALLQEERPQQHTSVAVFFYSTNGKAKTIHDLMDTALVSKSFNCENNAGKHFQVSAFALI